MLSIVTTYTQSLLVATRSCHCKTCTIFFSSKSYHWSILC